MVLRSVLIILLLLILVGIFLMYTEPSLMINLADKVWSCFG